MSAEKSEDEMRNEMLDKLAEQRVPKLVSKFMDINGVPASKEQFHAFIKSIYVCGVLDAIEAIWKERVRSN